MINIPFLTISSNMMKILEHTSIVAKLSRPIIIIGARGTGKELVAKRLHYLSGRWDKELITINCAALSEEFLASELFGHEQGSFTGATKRKLGKLELASEGTIFLDELGLLSPRIQEKLLRVLEYKEFERLGGTNTLLTNARIIGATNEDLPSKVKKGLFRADLLDRLAFDVITLPPLRNRPDDIIFLSEKFAVNMAIELKKPQFSGFSDLVKHQLKEYPWPGNVRQLKNVIERAVFFHENPRKKITEIILDPFDSPYRPIPPEKLMEPLKVNKDEAADSSIVFKIDEFDKINLEEQVMKLEKKLILFSAAKNKHHQAKISNSLGITYHKLRGLLKKHNIEISK